MGTVIGLYEFLYKVSKLKKTQEKIDALKANDSFPLRILLKAAFDPSVKWQLPPERPPFKPNDLVDQEHVLIKETEKFGYFLEGWNDLPAPKRESMFIELLEKVDKNDAELLVSIKDKKMPFPGITIIHVRGAFPELF
jgi:hypothetical protein